ncbi:MAG: type I-E CRISPR-associated protein Cas6/Cse3/CasE [Sedimentisphaerales bacterium]|nr:type I-E CRISPR-associated protein Cas6/Cse3/CasE [Sedimentisphaerales bacterium]
MHRLRSAARGSYQRCRTRQGIRFWAVVYCPRQPITGLFGGGAKPARVLWGLLQVVPIEVKSLPRIVDRSDGDGRFLNRIAVFGDQCEETLEVTDSEAFYQTLCCGIGPAKGLGMGLLSIAPA